MTQPGAIDDTLLDLLEPLLREFVVIIGMQATMALVEAFGGTRLHIAAKAAQNAQLVALIGAEKAAILGKEYGGERPLIPKALSALRACRDRQIKTDLQTLSVRQVALKYRLGERRVFQLSGQLENTTRDLFE